jgi:hypothetical protein
MKVEVPVLSIGAAGSPWLLHQYTRNVQYHSTLVASAQIILFIRNAEIFFKEVFWNSSWNNLFL